MGWRTGVWVKANSGCFKSPPGPQHTLEAGALLSLWLTCFGYSNERLIWKLAQSISTGNASRCDHHQGTSWTQKQCHHHSTTDHNNRLPQTTYSFTLVNSKLHYGLSNNPTPHTWTCLGYKTLWLIWNKIQKHHQSLIRLQAWEQTTLTSHATCIVK